MPDDLADRISEGAVAVLELVPGEKRFVDLSRHVLKGGAERFRPVVLEGEPVRYLVPVGVPGKKLDFGTLLVQRSRVALVWRADPSRPYHAVVCSLSPGTTVSQTAVVVRGETWGRFDLRDDAASMTFLVPPVATPDLPRALHSALIEEPGSRVARFATAPLATAITSPDDRDDTGGPVAFVFAADPDTPGAGSAPGDEEARDAAGAPTQVIPAAVGSPDDGPTQPEPADPYPADQYTAVQPRVPASDEVVPPSAHVSAAQPAPGYRERAATRRSPLGPDTTRGFFAGLLATLAAGAVVLILRLLGVWPS